MRGVKLIAQWHLSLPGPPPPPPPLPPAFGCDSRGPHNHMGYHLPLPISISLKIINWKQTLFLYYYIYHFPKIKIKIKIGSVVGGDWSQMHRRLYNVQENESWKWSYVFSITSLPLCFTFLYTKNTFNNFKTKKDQRVCVCLSFILFLNYC